MGTKHVLPPADSITAILAMAHQSDASLDHVRKCPACRLAWYRAGAFRSGCIDPRRGARVIAALGMTPLPGGVREHVERCLSCLLLVIDGSHAMAADNASS